MMNVFCFSSVLILAWIFGRNSLTNLFGTALSTRMLGFKFSAFLTVFFLLLGVLVNGRLSSQTTVSLVAVENNLDAFFITFSALITLLFFQNVGFPISLNQGVIGAMVGYGIMKGLNVNFSIFFYMLKAWILTPFFSAILAYLFFYSFKKLLLKYPVSIFLKDSYIRISLIISGILLAFLFGGNNITIMIAPYLKLGFFSFNQMLILVFLFIILGVYSLNKKVVYTIGVKIYPLSPLEALCISLSSVCLLFLFSGRMGLAAIPLMISGTLMGGIGGIVAAKKAYHSCNFKTLSYLFISWILTPFLTAIFCCFFLKIYSLWGKI